MRTPLTFESMAAASTAVSGFSRTNPAASASLPNSRRVSINTSESKVVRLIQRERIQRVTGRHENVLTPVDQVGFRRVRHRADLRVPERLAVRRIERDEIARYVAAEQQFAGDVSGNFIAF